MIILNKYSLFIANYEKYLILLAMILYNYS